MSKSIRTDPPLILLVNYFHSNIAIRIFGEQSISIADAVQFGRDDTEINIFHMLLHLEATLENSPNG